MVSFRRGSWSVGTKDGTTVYLDFYTGPDGTGDQVSNANLDPDLARQLGQALIDKADSIDPQR